MVTGSGGVSGRETDKSGFPTGGLASTDFLEGEGTVVSIELAVQVIESAIVIRISSISLSSSSFFGSLVYLGRVDVMDLGVDLVMHWQNLSSAMRPQC